MAQSSYGIDKNGLLFEEGGRRDNGHQIGTFYLKHRSQRRSYTQQEVAKYEGAYKEGAQT